MFFIEFQDGQGLGNQLWNYAALRSLSKELNYGYKVFNFNKFKGLDFLEIKELSNKKFNAFDKEKINIFDERIYYDNQLNTFSSDFDKSILKVKPNTLLNGLFQSEKYFFNYDINNFIKVRESNIKFSKNLCLLNIRGGEYKRFKNLILPKIYWDNAVKNMKSINKNLTFKIITDDYKYADKLFPEYEILKGNTAHDFIQIHNAEYLIVSNSSFSYFPISLGNKPKFIIAPALWSRFGNKFNRWCSPANYYDGWHYQDNEGRLLSEMLIKEYLCQTKYFYSSFNVLTTKNSLERKSILDYIPFNIKRKIKIILANIFPLNFG